MAEGRICNKMFNGFWISGNATEYYLLTLILCFSSVVSFSLITTIKIHTCHYLFVPFLLISFSFPILLFLYFHLSKSFLEAVIGYSALNCEIIFYITSFGLCWSICLLCILDLFFQLSKICKKAMFHFIQNVLMSFISKINIETFAVNSVYFFATEVIHTLSK